jgi:hypothetical protein
VLFKEIFKLPWREAMAILEKDKPTNCTWMKVSDFVENTYSQEQICQVIVFLWKTLDSMDLDSEESDEVRDCIEPWWYVMGKEARKQFDLEIKIILMRRGERFN